MAQVQTILASGDINTGPVVPRQSFDVPESTAQAGESISRGAEDLSQGVKTAARELWTEKRRLAQKQEYDNQLWAQGQYTNAQHDLISWTNDIQKTGSENVVDQFNQHYSAYQENALKNAPTPEAANILKRRFGELGNEGFSRALKIEAANRAQNTINSFEGMLKTNTDTIAQDPMSYAKIQSTMSDFVKGATEGQRITPEVAIQLNQHIANLGLVAAESMAGKDPDRAQQILDNAKGIEWQQRKAAQGEITRARGTNDALFQYQQNDLFKSHIESIQTTGQGIPGFSINNFLASRKSQNVGETEALRMEVMDKIDQANHIYVANSSLNGKTPTEIGEIMHDLQPKAGAVDFNRQSNIYDAVSQRAAEQVKLFKEDPFSYSRQDPVVNKAWSMVERLPQNALPQVRDQVVQQALASSVEWQRNAGVPASDISVLSSNTAKTMAGRINGGQLKEVQQLMSSMQQTYSKYWPEAFRDLVKLPADERISASNQVIALQAGKPWLQDFFTASRTADKDMPIEETARKLMTQKLLTDPTLISFKKSMIMSNPGNVDLANTFHQSIDKYAQYLMYTGKAKNVSAAVNQATTDVIGSAYGFANIGGNPIAVKRQQGRINFTDADVKGIGSALNKVTPTIDPSRIDLSNFSFPVALSDDAKMASVRRTITNDSFWVTKPDNTGAQLYMNGYGGSSAPVKYKDGQNVEQSFIDLLNQYNTDQVARKRAGLDMMIQAGSGMLPL